MGRAHGKHSKAGARHHITAAILVLLATSTCCFAKLEDAFNSIASAPAGSSLYPAGPSHGPKRHLAGHAAARVLAQQAQPGIVGDDEDFDWSAPKPEPQPEPSKPQQPAAPKQPTKPTQPTAQDKAATAPEAPAAAAASKEAQERPAAEQQQPAAKQPATPGKAEEEPQLAKLPDPQQAREAAAPAAAPAQQAKQREPAEADSKEAGGPAAAAATDAKTNPDDTTGAGAEKDKEKRAAEDEAAAAAVQDTEGDASEAEQEEAQPPVKDGTPALLGDHTAAATQQTQPGSQQQQQQQQQQRGPEPQAAASGEQQGAEKGSGTWVAAAPAQAAPKQGDVDPSGACKSWVQRFCEDVEAGAGHLADCLAQHQAATDTEEGRGKLEPLSSECHEEVLQVKILRSKSLDANPTLAKVCAEDIDRYCNVTLVTGSSARSVVACLKEAHATLQPACKKEVFKLRLDAAEDYRADEVLHSACKGDAQELCKGVSHGGGQIQACLKKQQAKLSPGCEEELFRKEAEDSGDIRLLVQLFRACLPDKKRFCADVPPGQARASQCLEEHRESLSEPCRAEVDAVLERRVRDFRLDSRLRAACRDTITQLCDVGDTAVGDTFDGAVSNCLQDFRDSIKDDACRAQVHKYQELAAQDIRFNPSLADACFEDRTTLCANVPPGSARVIRCLQNQRDKLSSVCRSTLMSEEVWFSENIDFQYPMKQACAREVERFCDVVPHGGGRVIRCLQDNLKQKDFSKGCREEVLRYQQESARDYRLNHRLYKACERDVADVCADACDVEQGEVCGGKVLACLSDRQQDIKSSACRKEVGYLQRMGVQDFRADMQLAEACRPDVESFCKTVEPGDGRVHKCLRENYDQLSPDCKREEVRLEAQEAENIQLNQGLMRTCAAERTLFCRDVRPGSARVFRCLAHSLANPDFGNGCRSAMLTKLRRREANWRLDPPLRKACHADVESLCAEEDASLSQDGAVKKCMVRQADALSEGCGRELVRSLYMAFFVWQPQGLLTSPCDADVQRMCLARVKEMDAMPGAVEMCLSEIVDAMAATQTSHRRLLAQSDDGKGNKQLPSSNSTARYMPRLSDECYQLAALAHTPKFERSPDFATAAYGLLEASLGRVQEATGLPTLAQDSKTGQVAVSLTGWTALAGVASLVVLLMTVATWAVRQYTNSPSHSGYTVIKNVPPLPRV